MICCFVSNKFDILKNICVIVTKCRYVFALHLRLSIVFQPWMATNLGCDVAIKKSNVLTFQTTKLYSWSYPFRQCTWNQSPLSEFRLTHPRYQHSSPQTSVRITLACFPPIVCLFKCFALVVDYFSFFTSLIGVNCLFCLLSFQVRRVQPFGY